jgi:hypothetical protein
MTTMLKNRLKDMKLAGIANSIDERIEYANKNHLSYQHFRNII